MHTVIFVFKSKKGPPMDVYSSDEGLSPVDNTQFTSIGGVIFIYIP